MSSCIKDLYDYNLIEQCQMCKNILLKSNFYKKKLIEMAMHLSVYLVENSIIMIFDRK